MKTLAPTPYIRFEPTPASALRRLARRLRAGSFALWHAACRHAERPDRFVPYY